MTSGQRTSQRLLYDMLDKALFWMMDIDVPRGSLSVKDQ